jgi:hypothetical protein
MIEQLTVMLPNLKAEILELVITKGFPKDNDLIALDKLADQILTKHRELKISD